MLLFFQGIFEKSSQLFSKQQFTVTTAPKKAKLITFILRPITDKWPILISYFILSKWIKNKTLTI